MKKFRFPLQKLRDWRQIRFEAEEARLAGLLHQRQQLALTRQRLTEESEAALVACATAATLRSEELLWLDSYRRFARAEAARLEGQMRGLEAQIDAQRRQLLEARCGVMVLDRLKDRQHQQWRKEADKEQEEMVAELVVARWKTVTNVR